MRSLLPRPPLYKGYSRDRADFHPLEARLYLKGKGRIDKEPIDLAAATVEAISDWLASMGESKSPALFVSSRDTRLSVDRLYQIVGALADSAGIDRAGSIKRLDTLVLQHY
jgi:integrase/recombinase XerC